MPSGAKLMSASMPRIDCHWVRSKLSDPAVVLGDRAELHLAVAVDLQAAVEEIEGRGGVREGDEQRRRDRRRNAATAAHSKTDARLTWNAMATPPRQTGPRHHIKPRRRSEATAARFCGTESRPTATTRRTSLATARPRAPPAAIHSPTFVSSSSRGRAPWPRTTSWNARWSKRGPSAVARALAQRQDRELAGLVGARLARPHDVALDLGHHVALGHAGVRAPCTRSPARGSSAGRGCPCRRRAAPRGSISAISAPRRSKAVGWNGSRGRAARRRAPSPRRRR